MADAEDTRKRREEARLAMEDETQRLHRQAKEEQAAKLRHAARLAMEGEPHRRQRELEERRVQLEKLTAEKQAAEAAAVLEAAAQARAAQEAAEEQDLAETDTHRRSAISSVITASEAIAKIKNLPINLTPLRTFKTDMAKAVRAGLSIARMALSEQNRKRGTTQPPLDTPTHKTRWYLVWPLILILIAATGVAVWKITLKQTPPAGPPLTIPTPIFVEDNREIPLERIRGSAIAEAMQDKMRTLAEASGRITQLYFTENRTVVSFPEFVLKAGWRLPEALLRNLTDDFLWGVYRQGEEQVPFVVFENNFFERAWDGMFQWEPTLWDQLGPFLKLPTESGPPSPLLTQFQDKIIRNKDARILADKLGNILLAYSFLDDRHILITRTEPAFIEVLKRFIAK